MPKEEPKTLEDAQNDCSHLGTRNPVTQNIIQTGSAVILVASHNCAYCGKLFVSLNPLDIKKPDISTLIKQ